MSKHIQLLYHFTCSHGHEGISKTGILLPNIYPFMSNLGPLLWLTDTAEPPSRESMGLTSAHLTCDRMAYRYSVQCKAAIPWCDIRSRAPVTVVAGLESFGQPEHWWVIRRQVTPSEFAYDESWAQERKEITQ